MDTYELSAFSNKKCVFSPVDFPIFFSFNGPSKRAGQHRGERDDDDDLFLSPFPVNESGAALSFHRQNKEEETEKTHSSFLLSLSL